MTAAEYETVTKLKAISMLSVDSLSKLRTFARLAEGPIVEVGAYVGGSTCAMADAVRTSGAPFITIEQGGEYLTHPQLPSTDILSDWRRNLAAWGLTEKVTLIPKLAHESVADLAAVLGDKKIGLLFIDADGSAGSIVECFKPWLTEGTFLILDDYTDGPGDTKGSQVRLYVEDLLHSGSVEFLGLDSVGSTWFGRLIVAPNHLPVPRAFTRESGHAWFAYPTFEARSDDNENPHASGLEVFENGLPIGPAHSLHDEIRNCGEGRFSHWKGRLYFSSSDNSDPNTNGRVYSIRLGDKSAALNIVAGATELSSTQRVRSIDSPLFSDYRSLLSRGRQELAFNLQNRTNVEVSAAADYSVRTGKVGHDVIAAAGAALNGTILELGPGWDFGGAMLLGEQSRKLIVADRFIAPWDDKFHPAVYKQMQRLLGRPSRILDEVVRTNSYAGLVDCLEEPAYDLKSIASGSVDLIYSNAVLEHVHPLDMAAREMFRVTTPGGLGIHQVDFRYHRDFNQPLEYLLFTREEYAELLDLTHCETGCQTRVREAADMFIAAGFEVVKIDVNMTATEAYMQDFLPRLRRSEASPYKTWPAEELAKISARLFVRKS